MSKVFVFGHQNPDSDAIRVFHYWIRCYLKRQLGVDAEAVALGTPNEETAFVLDYFGVEAHEWLSLLNQRELIKLFLQTIMSFNNLFQILRTLKLLR